jgi:hypothetical protein
MPFRLKGPESLAVELTLCARFGERQAVQGVPPLAIRKAPGLLCQTLGWGHRARPRIDTGLPTHSGTASLRSEDGRMSRCSKGALS